ncbi:MAG: sugar ABC transporter permease [Lachnospiraceae bacterium]|nr:sugar ABC transporter permease [Lachnospiraceae bacterium]MBD5456153.1 sugar ABC transporter permease [Lachnospiraceae bacterium]
MKGHKLAAFWAKAKRWAPVYLMLLPGAVYLIINNYIPMFGLVVAFKQYNVRDGIFGSKNIGLKNFTFLFRSSDSWVAIRNTLLYNFTFIMVTLIVAVTLAILIHEITSKRARSFFQSTVLLPYLFSITIISYMVYAFLGTDSGFINNTIFSLLHIDPINWYSTQKYWPWILLIVNTWKSVGYSCLIYIAAIDGIDTQLIEAAKLDGANKWQQIQNIVFPALVPSVITLTMLHIGKIFYSDFGLFYQVPMNSGILTEVTQTMDTYVYRMLVNVGNIGMSSAACVVQSIVGLVMILLANMAVRKWSRENALF